MNKSIIVFCVLVASTLIAGNSFAQTGQICFTRATGYVGSAVNFKVYIDDSLACKLKNKTYSIHTVNAGDHMVSASGTGLSNKRKSPPFKVTVEEGKITYVDVIWANKVQVEEVTENTGTQKIKTLVENTKCSTAEN